MTTYRLDRAPRAAVVPPVLDESQQAVVDHEGGPVLVLAGPGTGKTTTLVEAVVNLVETKGVDPGSILALTFSRKAAEQLRDRVTARLGRTMSTTLSSTFHSFAYGLLRAYSTADRSAEPLRLLSAPEQDVVLRELLSNAEESVTWPEELKAAVGTRGFATEVHAVLARAREKRIDAFTLQKLGAEEGRADWVAAGLFMEQYLINLDSQSAIDYANLVFEAVNIAAHPDVMPQLRARYSHVFVDEYQDTDPSQVALLKAIAGDGRNLVVVGDPDQSIYGFRGAEVRGILDFPDTFKQSDGSPAPVIALGTTRRFGSRLLRASRNIATALPRSGHIPAAPWETFRHPTSVATNHGRVAVATYDTARAETEHVADALRRAHLEDGIPWSEMAVLVRSGRATIPTLRRSLLAAGVPIDVASDETPLVREPAVLPLLDGLRVVANLGNEDKLHPDYVDAARAEGLLLSALGGMDAAEVRVLARSLRHRDKHAASSAELVRTAVIDPSTLAGLPSGAAKKARRLTKLLHDARAQLDAQATAEEVLWTLWSGTEWPARLRRSAISGGPGALMAHRDLDAVCALFEAAARAEEQRGHTSVVSFLETLVAQQIPADSLAERGVRGDAVRLLTAHRSKGLEWRFVVLAHVQEGTWPDLRRRATLLHADQLGLDGIVPPITMRELLAEERRLFYVGTTRARERLLVTAVRSPDDDGEQPSRFLTELGPEVDVSHLQGRPRRPLSLPGLVAQLRQTAADDAKPLPLRQAAARRLARLLAETDHGHALVPHAHPSGWWGTRGRSVSMTPVRSAEEPITLSASALDSILTCPARWFLEKEAGGAVQSTASQGFGLVVHALADRIAKGDLATTDDLMPYVDSVWEQLSFRTPWSASRERVEVEKALARFIAWHTAPGARTVIATEQEMRAEVTLPNGEQVRLYGYADRLELDEGGKVWVVDLKTGKYPPAEGTLSDNPQLGLYQLAVDNGAVDELLEREAESGGAELIQLRHEVKGKVKVQPQPAQVAGDDGHKPIEVQLMSAVQAIREERFLAKAGDHCTRCSFTAFCPAQSGGNVLS
ncbi:MAG TPA: ATP-dependent DNA helicase [Nocardioidaceae bacterium]|nr:ATP-dependent DNA helicase [Nocardioidaceae bacterium]